MPRVTAAVIAEQGEDGLFVSAFDHGGAGGGYENTWGTGKLYFGAMKVKNIRIHNRPAYNSEVHGSRDMGVGELNNCYEDAELADTIVAVGTNALETQTNYFLNHWVPNLRGTSMDKKKAEFGSEPVDRGRIVVVDPRRTVTVNACEVEAGKENVLHLAINSGTDLILFNAWLTYAADKGWIDKPFIAASTKDFDKALAANKVSIADAAKTTGLSEADIVKAITWIAEPKTGGARRRTMFAYEKGLIWGNDNYRTNQSLVNLALATGNVGRPGGGCVRMGGHQEGYSRPSDAHVGKPAAYVDQLLIGGKGGVHHIWACDHYKTTLNAMEFKRVYKKRTDIVKDAMNTVPYGDRKAMVKAIVDAIKKGGLFAVDVDIVPTKIGQACHVILPAATSGEMNLTSMNGERRMRLTERYMDPPGNAMPDCLIAARIANNMERVFREMGKADIADKFKGFDWKTEEDAFMDGYHGHEKGGEFVTYARLRAMGTNGFQEPATSVDSSGGKEKIVGTKRLFADGKFNSKDGKATFASAQWRGLQAAGKQAEKEKFPFLINNGRANLVWQSAYLDQDNEFVMDRWPYPFIEMNPQDMSDLKLKNGDLVEVYNDNGSTQAMVYPTPTAKRKQAFMLFAFPTGRPRQRCFQGRERADHPELQADMGKHPQDFGCPGRRPAPDLQVQGILHLRTTRAPYVGALAFSCSGPSFEMNISPEPYPILAIVYSDGLAADRFISDLGYRIRDAGIGVAGIVQHNKFIRDRTKCDMAVEELASGTVLQLSEDRGRGSARMPNGSGSIIGSSRPDLHLSQQRTGTRDPQQIRQTRGRGPGIARHALRGRPTRRANYSRCPLPQH